MDRRTFLRGATGVAGATAGALGLRPATAEAGRSAPVFGHGVASGDPLPGAVIIWTRVTPPTAEGHGTGSPVEVTWVMATDEALTDVVGTGTVTSSAASDHTIKIDVAGLDPATHYFFGFTALGESSEVARTKTAPAADAEVPDVRFGVASCANWEAGFFGAYRCMAELADRDGHDLDFVLHVGDYLYEYENGRYGPGAGDDPPRLHDPPTEMIELDDYRRRHAQYKTDPHLRMLHLRFPFITTWDDHELTDNTWRDGAENHTDATEGPWPPRKQAAIQAYFEWMPVREQPGPILVAEGEIQRLYRDFRFGDLVDLHVLDLRQYRDEAAASLAASALTTDFAKLAEPGRTITGPTQLAWLKDGLAGSDTCWHLVGNPVMITPIRFGNASDYPDGTLDVLGEALLVRPQDGAPLNTDDWSGYPFDQADLLGLLAGTDTGTPIKNVVFLTGDIHTSWACDVPIDPATYPVTESVAVEFVTTSVTSKNFDEIARDEGATAEQADAFVVGLEAGASATNPQIRYLDASNHGFAIVDVNGDRTQQDWYFIDDRLDPETPCSFGASWESKKDTCAVSEVGEPLGVRARAYDPDDSAGTPTPTAAPVEATQATMPATGGSGVPGGAATGVAAAAAAAALAATRRAAADDGPR